MTRFKTAATRRCHHINLSLEEITFIVTAMEGMKYLNREQMALRVELYTRLEATL